LLANKIVQTEVRLGHPLGKNKQVDNKAVVGQPNIQTAAQSNKARDDAAQLASGQSAQDTFHYFLRGAFVEYL